MALLTRTEIAPSQEFRKGKVPSASYTLTDYQGIACGFPLSQPEPEPC